MTKKQTAKKNPNKPDEQFIKNAIYVTEAFHFSADKALKFINQGLLGYKVDANGIEMMKDGKKIPITIGRTKFFESRQKYNELPEMYEYLRNFALQGYTKTIVGFQEELKVLHELSAQNMLAVTDPLDRQTVIDSLISKVIPTESAFADMLKHIIEQNPSMTGEKTSKEAEPIAN